jgi:hypothetical protein
MMRALLVALACLALNGCRSCASSDGSKTVVSDAGAGIESIQVGKATKPDATANAGLQPDAPKMVRVEVRGWSTAPSKPRAIKPADARARKALAQALSGYRFAITGEKKVMVMAHPPTALPPHTIVRSRAIGLDQAMIRFDVPDPGGQTAMATGRMMIGRVKPTAVHINSAKLNALRRIAKETGGSGQILPTNLGEPRIVDGILLLELTARVFRDGTP